MPITKATSPIKRVAVKEAKEEVIQEKSVKEPSIKDLLNHQAKINRGVE